MRGHGTQIITVKIAAVGEQQVTAQTVSRRQLGTLSERIGRQDHLLDTLPAQVPRHMQFHRRRLSHPHRKRKRFTAHSAHDITRLVMNVDQPNDQKAFAAKRMEAVRDDDF